MPRITVAANPTAITIVVRMLGIITTGDTALSDIARKANINRVTHIDNKFENILGLYAKYCVVVYGD